MNPFRTIVVDDQESMGFGLFFCPETPESGTERKNDAKAARRKRKTLSQAVGWSGTSGTEGERVDLSHGSPPLDAGAPPISWRTRVRR
jgi:hypothetical protein